MTLVGTARRTSTITFGNTVERPRLLDLLPRSDGVSFLQKLREGSASAFRYLVLQVLGQVGERHVRVNRLHIAEQLVGQAPPKRASARQFPRESPRR
jgi:hypothetical protein